MTYKADRREQERRLHREFVEFPFTDSNGVEVKCDRRKQDDRRSKITITSEFISEAEFKEYFEII